MSLWSVILLVNASFKGNLMENMNPQNHCQSTWYKNSSIHYQMSGYRS